MTLYETIFLTRPEISERQVEELREKYQAIIKDGGGKIGEHEYWGLRQLSYRINKNTRAHYIFMNIEANKEAVAEMERIMRIDENTLRYMTVKVEKHRTLPTPIMSNKDSPANDRSDNRSFDSRNNRDNRTRHNNNS